MSHLSLKMALMTVGTILDRSLLSILSKDSEEHVAASFMDYLIGAVLLYELQSAFRAGQFHRVRSDQFK